MKFLGGKGLDWVKQNPWKTGLGVGAGILGIGGLMSLLGGGSNQQQQPNIVINNGSAGMPDKKYSFDKPGITS